MDDRRKKIIKTPLKATVLLLLWISIAVGVCADQEQGADKNGVSPNVINLPKGPGSVEGLGESFKPQLNTGSAMYAINISVPAGPNGHRPQLALRYDSNKGFGLPGIGWDLDLVYIARQTNKGLPKYDDEADWFIDSDKEELVSLGNGTFRRKIEGAFIRYQKVGTSWRAELKDGTKLYFGQSQNSRVFNRNLINPGQQIYKWLLDQQTDANGNTIRYRYSDFPDSDNQKYLSHITYGPGPGPWSIFYFIHFAYQPEDRPDWRKDYRSGFCIKTTKRLGEIRIGIQGMLPDQCEVGDWNQDQIPDALISRYVLSYDDTNLVHSFLSSVTKYGSDSKGLSLPPITFGYSKFNPLLTMSARHALITCLNAPLAAFDNDRVEIVDLNSDGLPDLLKTDYASQVHTAYVNEGVQVINGIKQIVWSNAQQLSHDDGFSSTLDLSNNRVHLADMDGNGRADLVHTTFFNQVSFHANKGTLGWASRQSMSVQSTSPPSPFYDTRARTTDLDFDKRFDILKSSTNGYSAWLNVDLGHYSQETRTPGALYNGQVLQFTDKTVHLADMNGDRLNDVVKVRADSIIYCASMGRGVFDEAVVIAIPDKVLTTGPNGQVERARLIDINGDGLADLVVERAAVNELWYWINLGTDRLSPVHKITDMPQIFNARTATRWADMNGNGTEDIIYGDSSAQQRLVIIDIGELVGGSFHPNLLTTVNNGLGAVTIIDYRSSTDFYVQDTLDSDHWQTTLPFPVHVVNRVTSEVARIDDTNDIYISDYSYWSGYYDEAEKEFRGFARENTCQYGDETAPSFHAVSEFHTGQIHECLKGKLKTLQIEDAFKLYSIQQNAWDYEVLDTGADGRDVCFPCNNSTKQIIYEGTQDPKTLLTTYQYDNYGNTIKENKYGLINPNISDPNGFALGGDEILIERQFIHNELKWIHDRLLYEKMSDVNDVQVSRTEYCYDDLSYGELSRGNLTCRLDWLDTENRYIQTIRNDYDEWGNITQITNANNHVRTLVYDPTFHTYPIKEIVHLDGYDLTLGVSYNIGLGTITDANDFTGVVTTFGYDTLGRLNVINAPGEANTEFDYDLASPVSRIRTRITEDDLGNEFVSYSYFDGMSRELGTKKEAENGLWTFENAVSFNKRGLVQKKWLPRFTGSFNYELPDLADPNHVSFEYDALERVIKTTNSDGTSSKTVFTPLSEHLYDENDTAGINTPKTLIYDGQERLTEVIERNADDPNTSEYLTRYAWTTLGDLAKISDAHRNIKLLQYDSLRRKFFMNDPDRGHMHYTYDDVGNLIRTKDAKSQEIVYSYDWAERLKTENYLDSTGDPDTDPNDVIYHYDIPMPNVDFGNNTTGTASHTLGRLAWVEDLSGQEHFSYDPRGNIQWSVKRIMDPKAQVLVSYKSAFEYDRMNRLTDIVYPDNDHVHYEYNDASLLESIKGGANGHTILSNVNYQPSGQKNLAQFGNKVSMAYQYDIRNRLKNLKTSSPTDTELIHYTYDYDHVSNIVQITDHRPFTTVAREAPRRNTQVFQYDDLYRLTQVRYARQDNFSADFGRINYVYDAIGNMLSKSSPAAGLPGHIEDDGNVNLGNFAYGGGRHSRIGRDPGDLPGPHALTGTANGDLYEYDANGNMTGIEGAACTWDYQDRLIRYEKDGVIAQYSYDYTGRRITKKVTKDSKTTQTLYPNRVFEVRPNCAPTKYIFDGQNRIARIKGTLNPDTAGQRLHRLWLYKGMNLVCIAVETTATVGEIFQTSEIYTYDQGIYQLIPALAIPQVGSPLWVKSETHKVIVVKGAYDDSVYTRAVAGNESLVGWPRLEPFCPNIHIEGDFRVFAYDSYLDKWFMQNTLAGIPAFLSNMPGRLDAASAVWFKESHAAHLTSQPTKANDILFYHSDHLGSSNAITDIAGNLVEETAFYPFGTPRNEYTANNNPFKSNYKFTGKELDEESKLQYFEARYLVSKVGRFASVDTYRTNTPHLIRTKPQRNNIYTYCLNNPLAMNDPSGYLEAQVVLPDINNHSVTQLPDGSEFHDFTGNQAETKPNKTSFGLMFKGVGIKFIDNIDKTKIVKDGQRVEAAFEAGFGVFKMKADMVKEFREEDIDSIGNKFMYREGAFSIKILGVSIGIEVKEAKLRKMSTDEKSKANMSKYPKVVNPIFGFEKSFFSTWYGVGKESGGIDTGISVDNKKGIEIKGVNSAW